MRISRSKIPNISILQSQLASTSSDKKKKLYLDFSTNEKKKILPHVRIKCKCSRKMPIEEMFVCTTCCESLCSYCTKNEIFCYTCYSCSKSHIPAMIHNINYNAKNVCASCLECPMCMNILSTKSMDKKVVQDPYFFYCKFCFWNSKNYAISSSTSDKLVKDNFDFT